MTSQGGMTDWHLHAVAVYCHQGAVSKLCGSGSCLCCWWSSAQLLLHCEMELCWKLAIKDTEDFFTPFLFKQTFQPITILPTHHHCPIKPCWFFAGPHTLTHPNLCDTNTVPEHHPLCISSQKGFFSHDWWTAFSATFQSVYIIKLLHQRRALPVPTHSNSNLLECKLWQTKTLKKNGIEVMDLKNKEACQTILYMCSQKCSLGVNFGRTINNM